MVDLSVHHKNFRKLLARLEQNVTEYSVSRVDAHITSMLLCDGLSWGYGPLIIVVLIFITCVASRSDVTPCNKINKPLVVYRLKKY